MSDIQERKTKKGPRFTARLRIKGFPTQTQTFPNKTLAKEWLKKTETELKQGYVNPHSRAEKYTINNIIDAYEKNVLPTKKPKEQKQIKTMLTWFKNEIGAYSLTGITTEILVKCRDKLAHKEKQVPMRNGKIKTLDSTIKPATVNKHLIYMSAVFQYCVRDLDILQFNPMNKVRKLSINNARKRFIDKKEIAKLLEKCRQKDEELYLCTLIALLTAARKGEVLNLTWDDIDFEYITQNGSKGMIKYLKTKNGEDRFIPMHPLLYDELLNFKKSQTVRQLNNDYIFKNENGKPKETLIGKLFPKAVKECGIDDFRFHDLRHTFASWEAMGGVPQQITQKTLGHKTPQMYQRYSHLLADSLSQYINETGDKLLEDFKPKLVQN